MGAVTFSLDVRLIECLKVVLRLTTLVKTGIFQAETVEAMLPYFDNIVSIESPHNLCEASSKRFKAIERVQVLRGNLSDYLPALAPPIFHQSTVYWFDAHWFATLKTSVELSQHPMVKEIDSIGHLNDQSVLIFSNYYHLLATLSESYDVRQWPEFDEIILALRKLSPHHRLMVVSDAVIFYPLSVHKVLQDYILQSGIDRFYGGLSYSENELLRCSLEEKERIIQEKRVENVHMSAENISLKASLEEKELLIQALIAFQLSTPRARNRATLIPKRLTEIFRPRLGNLNQYMPRPLECRSIKKINSATEQPHPKISLVTPSFAQGEYIEKTLSSVLDQGYPNLEYFVQDGGSKDNTITVLKRYENKLSGWVSQADGGQSQAINLGFSKTTGDIMAWLNSDDLLLPGSLAVVVDYFHRHPNIDVVYGNRLLIDSQGREIGRWILPGHNDTVLSWVDYIPQETLFWRRSLWEKVGGHIDETFRFAMDWDLLIRFRDAGARFGHIPYFLGAFRIHDFQKTSAAINEVGFEEMNRLRERTLGRIPSRREIHKAIWFFMLKHIAVDMIYRLKTRIMRLR